MARILVIDEDAVMRRLLRALFARQGYEVVEATNGEEGLRCYHAAPPDLVITDLAMPVMDGIQLLLVLRHVVPPAVVIALSGHPHLLTQARTLTPYTFAKPFEPDELLTAVQQLVAAPGAHAHAPSLPAPTPSQERSLPLVIPAVPLDTAASRRPVTTLYVPPQGPATIVCPHCGQPSVLQLPERPWPHPFHVTCPCGAPWAVASEVRKFARKPVRLAGEYHRRAWRGRMLVDNVSRGGLGFRPEHPQTLRVDERITVRFRLDDPQRSEVSAPAVVRRVAGALVGAAFLDIGASTAANCLLGGYVA